MVIDAQVVERVVLAVVHQQRCRLAPTLVTAGRLPGPHRRDQAPRERQGRLHLVRTDGLREDRRAEQHIAGDREGPA
jgi:hypothetical protein